MITALQDIALFTHNNCYGAIDYILYYCVYVYNVQYIFRRGLSGSAASYRRVAKSGVEKGRNVVHGPRLTVTTRTPVAADSSSSVIVRTS